MPRQEAGGDHVKRGDGERVMPFRTATANRGAGSGQEAAVGVAPIVGLALRGKNGLARPPGTHSLRRSKNTRRLKEWPSTAH